MKKFLIFLLGIAVAVVGMYFIFNKTPTPDQPPINNEQQQPGDNTGDDNNVNPDNPSDVGGLDYQSACVLDSHALIDTSTNTHLWLAESFSGSVQDIINHNAYLDGSNTYMTSAELVASSVLNPDYSAGFSKEKLYYSGEIEVDDDTYRSFDYTDINTYDTPFVVGENNYFWNGERITLEEISAMNFGSFVFIGHNGSINYDNHSVALNFVIVAFDYNSTYQSADGSVVLHFGDNSGNESYFSDNNFMAGSHLQIYPSYLGVSHSFDPETGMEKQLFGFNVSYSDSDGNYFDTCLEMIDYNTFSYNGITLTKVVS